MPSLSLSKVGHVFVKGRFLSSQPLTHRMPQSALNAQLAAKGWRPKNQPFANVLPTFDTPYKSRLCAITETRRRVANWPINSTLRKCKHTDKLH